MRDDTNKGRTDIAVAVSLIVVCIAVFLYTFTFPEKVRSVGVSTFPRIIVGIIFFLSLILIARTIFSKNESAVNPFYISKEVLSKMGLSLLSLIAYIVLIGVLGFLISTPIFLFSLIVTFGERRYLFTGFIAIALTIVIYLMFHTVAKVPFPEGLIENLF